MLGVRIYLHSLRQVFGNLGAALRVSGLLYLVQTLVVFLIGISVLTSLTDFGALARSNFTFLRVAAWLTVTVVTGIWMAVAWHRFILRSELPRSILPPFPRDSFASYLGWGAILVIIALFLFFALGLLGAIAARSLFATSPQLAFVAAVFIVKIPLATILFCLSPALPSAAVRENLTIGQGWEKTRGHILDILIVAILLVATELLVDYLLGYLPRVFWLMQVVNIVLGWVYWAVGISIISTIYGHLVEGRPLKA